MAGRLQVAREFRPEECAPGCAAKRPNKNPRARLGLARQQFGKIGVGKLFRDAHTDSSVLDRREAAQGAEVEGGERVGHDAHEPSLEAAHADPGRAAVVALVG